MGDAPLETPATFSARGQRPRASGDVDFTPPQLTTGRSVKELKEAWKNPATLSPEPSPSEKPAVRPSLRSTASISDRQGLLFGTSPEKPAPADAPSASKAETPEGMASSVASSVVERALAYEAARKSTAPSSTTAAPPMWIALRNCLPCVGKGPVL